MTETDGDTLNPLFAALKDDNADLVAVLNAPGTEAVATGDLVLKAANEGETMPAAWRSSA